VLENISFTAFKIKLGPFYIIYFSVMQYLSEEIYLFIVISYSLYVEESIPN